MIFAPHCVRLKKQEERPNALTHTIVVSGCGQPGEEDGNVPMEHASSKGSQPGLRMKIYTDTEIDNLIKEPKRLPPDYQERVVPKLKQGFKERELEIVGDNGSCFRIIFKVGLINPMSFEVILCWIVPLTNQVFRLRRYDGKYHEHTNRIEKDRFYDFHVHYATERYQVAGFHSDGYAVADNRYTDYYGAMLCLFNDCGFIYPPESNRDLFDQV